MPARRAAEPKPITGPVLIAALAVGGYAIWNDYPGLAAIWAGLIVAAWTHPPAVFSGKKDARGYGTPADPGEQAAMSKYRYWADLKTKLFVPGTDWLPGMKVQGTWILASLAGFAAYWVPVSDPYTKGYGPWIDAAAVFLSVAVPAAAARRNTAPDDVSPGTTVAALVALARKQPGKVAGLTAAGVALGAAAGTVLAVFVPALLALAHRPGIPEPAIWAVCLAGGPLATLWKPWSAEALEHWRVIVAAREEWNPRWAMLKQDPPPRLVDRRTVGAATVDTFDAPASTGSMTYLPMASKITPALGAGSRVAVLDVPNLDSKGQPTPGTRHPLRFEIAAVPGDQVPDLTDAGVPKDEAELLARCAIAWTTDRLGCGRIILDDIALLTAPPAPTTRDDTDGDGPAWAQDSPSPAVWGMTWYAPEGPDAGYLRGVAADFAGAFNAPVLIDHRGNGGAGIAYVGAYDPQYGPDWAPSAGVNDDTIQELIEDAAWDSQWSDVMKQGANPPVRQGATAKEGALKDGTQVRSVSFVTRLGMPPSEFFPLEHKLPTVLNAAPFVAMTYYPAQGARAGERHAQAFTVLWSDRSVPGKPEAVAPVAGSEAPKWVLTAHVNQMFAAARLPRPEVVRATPMTKPESRQHIWKLDLRLFDGVTLAEVRGMAEKMRQNRGSEWLRVAQAPEGCVIYMGARPGKVKLARPDTALELDRLDWQQILIDSGLTGIAGRMPNLTKVDHLPRNEQVKVLDFDLTGTGLEFTAFTAVRGKLEANSGNAWVQPRRVKNSATSIQLLVCEVDPMPEKAGYDWDEVASSTVIPFATGVDGEPIAFNFRLDPHLLVAGASGGGKLLDASTRIPVPVSERFPDGWALNSELVEGDLVYAADGSKTRVVGFSEWTTEPGYTVRFRDGQTVVAGASHLWKVSTADTRAAWGSRKTGARTARFAERKAAASRLRDLASRIPVGTCAPLADIAVMAGFNELSLYGMSLPIEHLADVVALPSAKKAQFYDMTPVDVWLRSPKAKSGGTASFAGRALTSAVVASFGLRGKWLTARELADTLVCGSSTRAERDLAKQILQRLKPEARDGVTTFATAVYPVDEVLGLLADRLDAQASGRGVRDLERIVTTEEMAGSLLRVTAARSAVNYAVRLTEPIDGPDADLPVDPYVLGAWLGDGSSNGGGFTGIDHEITDEIERAGFEVRHRADEKSHHIVGLLGHLRTAGVLNRKHIPSIYLRASFRQRLSLLQGLMDTDGTVALDGGCAIDLCDEGLANGVLELIRSLGIRVALREAPATITEADPDRPGATRQRTVGIRYRMQFTTDLTVFRLPRKAGRLPERLRPTQEWNYVDDITVGEPVRMRCIKVEHPEHLFLVEGFVPTHNSVLMQSILFGAVMRGYECFVVDPTKGGADFRFAEQYARGFTGDITEAAAMMKALYTEVVRRKNLNTQYGVGKYSDLPPDVRPAHVFVFLDEFTSLMGQDPVPAASDDPEMDEERDLVLALNHARLQIGTYTGKIAREARSAGFTLVLATQKLSAKLLDTIPGAGDLKVNLSRILMGKATYGDKQSALRAPQDAPDLGEAIPPGRGLFETTAGAAMAIQAWYDSAEQAILSSKLAEAGIPTLAEDEKLPLTGPEKARAKREPEAAELPSLTLDVADLDLGELELTLDDLEDETDAEMPDAPAAEGSPADEEPAWEDEPMSGTAVFLDVEGVIAPFAAADGHDRIAAPGHGTVSYDPQVVARIAALDTNLAWLTDWDTDAPEAFGHLIPRATMVLPYGTEETGWWKIDSLLVFAEQNPAVRRIAWIDGGLAEEDALLGVTFREIADDALADAGIESLLLSPDPHTGATAHDVARLEAFSAGRPDPGPAPAAETAPHWLDALDSEDPVADGRAAASDDGDAPAATPAAAGPLDEFESAPKKFVPPPSYDDTDDFTVEPKRAVMPVPDYTEDDPFA